MGQYAVVQNYCLWMIFVCVLSCLYMCTNHTPSLNVESVYCFKVILLHICFSLRPNLSNVFNKVYSTIDTKFLKGTFFLTQERVTFSNTWWSLGRDKAKACELEKYCSIREKIRPLCHKQKLLSSLPGLVLAVKLNFREWGAILT